MKLAALSARPSIGRACLHQQLRHSSCEACRHACPFDAIKPENGCMVLNADICTSCGNCQFVCPTAALENLSAPQRSFHGAALIAPFSIIPPTVEELLIWHTERGVRCVELDIETSPGWLVALARLNLRLKQLGEPCWTVAQPEEKPVNTGRRSWLRINKADASTASVLPARGLNNSSFALSLEKSSCYLCSACSRICPQAAIEINDEAFTLHHSRCNGCKACTDVCLPHALTLTNYLQSGTTRFSVKSTGCTTCQQLFLTWPGGSNECPVCQRHAFGMREA